jgi:enterochelin esterase-like enzyme
MHDGQNLFDASRAAFGEWGVDEALSALVATGRTHGAVVVGIENTTHRRREYLPAPLLEAIAPPVRASILASIEGASESGGYIRFLTDELKPAIDNQFRVRTDRANTFVMGSSMGGLISLEALFQRPDVFGAAACLSTHWPLRFEPFESADAMVAWQEAVLPAITGYIEAGAPRPGRHRILFDHGTLNLDRWYRPYQLAADTAFLRLGYGDRADYRSTVYPGADHNEPSWRARLETPLRFLLGLEEQQ